MRVLDDGSEWRATTHLSPCAVDEEASAISTVTADHGQARSILREQAQEGELRANGQGQLRAQGRA